nr:putative transposase, Ptta/En/Spm, plant [Tanacetum cinerariifolium]
MAKLGHIPRYLKGRSASGRNILANECLQRELQSEKEKTKKLQMHINKIEKKRKNLKQKVDYLMKHLPCLSGWKSQSMARAINSQLAIQHKSRRWRLHNHYKNYPTKEQAIMNPPRGVKIPDWVLLCDRFASEDFETRNKMNRSKKLVPPDVGSKSMARVVHEKMKQGKQVTAIGRYEICHYSRKKDGMINETADKILRDLRDEEANSSSTPAEICMAKLGHIPGYLKGRSASGRNILANECLQRELQSEKEKTKKLQMHINKIEKKHNNIKQKVDYLMKHLPRLSGWKSQVTLP